MLLHGWTESICITVDGVPLSFSNETRLNSPNSGTFLEEMRRYFKILVCINCVLTLFTHYKIDPLKATSCSAQQLAPLLPIMRSYVMK